MHFRRLASAAVPCTLVAALTIVTLAATVPSAAASTDDDGVTVEVVSGRADLVTGGDALLRLRAPDGLVEELRVTVDAHDISDAFVPQPDGTSLGLATGLRDDTNLVQAELPDGRGARLTLTNAAQSGPVFSGPQIQPWTCTNGSAEPDCSEDPQVSYWYRSTDPTRAGTPVTTPFGAVVGSLQPYDPADPPPDVATVTTDEGHEVPFIVREEVGTSLRDQYRIAALWDPAQGGWPDPTAQNRGYANKLVLTHGASCDTEYLSAEAPAVLFEDALAQGFAVASHALDNAGHNCNLVTQAESLVVTKEMVAERFGPIRYTIGSGCSGGSLVQQQVANAYPGVYQGITPQCSFPDAWSSAQQYIDYVGLRAYLEGEGTVETGIVPAQWPSIFGHANPANQVTFTEVIPNSGEPTRSCPGVAEEDVYSDDNPDGVRCTLQDYMVNVFGETPDGKARRPISNVGIQYGLSGLLSFLNGDADPTRPPLTPDQFVALNAGLGGFDIDLDRIPERTSADPLAQERAYRSGVVNTGANLDQVAIIDLGGPEPGAFHDVYRKYAMRDRLIREHGTAANQVLWEGQTPLLGNVEFIDQSIRAMDEWLAAVEADGRDVPLPQRIIDARTEAGVEDRCVAGDGTDVPLEVCEVTVDATLFSSPRIEAGGGDPIVGFADDTLDCQTMAIESFDYAGHAFTDVFTPAQQETLRATFPTGVCDYERPGHGFQDAVPWLTYQDADGAVIHGGRPLGPAPVSEGYGAAAAEAAAPPTASSSRRGLELPTTGLATPLAGWGVLALGAGLAVRRRRG